MPELPEVQRVLMSLQPHLVGGRVARATLKRKDICEHQGRRRGAASLLQGQTIAALHRHGKQLAIVGSAGSVVCVHLGMSGQLLWCSSPAGLTHVHLVLTLNRPTGGQGRLIFRDPRRFGGIWTFDSLDQLRHQRWSTLGPDALSVTADQLEAALADSGRSIKAALLDQAVVAGIGNIYADEALFWAGIRPTRPARSLQLSETRQLAAAIVESLQRAIAAGGTTLRDYLDGNGQAGGGRLVLAAYGRAGQPCTRCGKPLKSGQVAQRTTTWCPKCQA